MTETEMLALMKRFRIAYGKGDATALKAAVTSDFVWHQHYATSASERPTGRVLQGVDAVIAEIQWRREHWRDVRYENLEERSAGDLLVQTFVVTGFEDDVLFHANAVDLYPVIDGKIARKDTYWKYLAH